MIPSWMEEGLGWWRRREAKAGVGAETTGAEMTEEVRVIGAEAEAWIIGEA